MKNILTIVTIIVFFVIGIFIGNAQWFKNLFAPKINGGSSTNGNGTNDETGDLPIDQNAVERNSQRGWSAPPPIILLPVNNLCQTYTVANPYHHMGCSYVFGGYISQNGIRMCQLKKVSCP